MKLVLISQLLVPDCLNDPLLGLLGLTTTKQRCTALHPRSRNNNSNEDQQWSVAATKTPGADSILQSRPSLLYLKVNETLEFQGIYLVVNSYPNFYIWPSTPLSVFKNKSLSQFYCPGLFQLFHIHTRWEQSKYVTKIEISRGIFEKTQNLYIRKKIPWILCNIHVINYWF